ncbi:uncharacterized protein SPSK_05907 [Sporothrix schenckii 1099-18]|uniref:Uncharacterized protein n=1 Tax=Sporothrix schenckii 1099-18 TaxID=1397361 RepID=A0A0F2MIC3_SPOSC|nr:uncharacterized protein SPSK_05907 [Sporothrix schenckii 1099-18]KJR89387.1 hypothetical protein SPSK_05907 [Sporothrix schenckii 1099-18]
MDEPEKPKQKEVRRPFWEQPPPLTEAELAERRARRRAGKQKIAELAKEKEILEARLERQARALQPPRRPEGKGRPIRFARKLNANMPYIERNVKPVAIQKPSVPALPPVEPEPAPEEVAPKDGKHDKSKETKRPPPLDITLNNAAAAAIAKERRPVSPPDRPPRPMRLADESGVTLHHILLVVNEALRVEMQKNQDVHDALSQDIQGPMHVLGDLGRLVNMLFWSMEQHRKGLWRNRRTAIQPGQPDEPNKPAPVKEPWRGALAIFSIPMRFFTIPTQDTSRDDLENSHPSENIDADGEDGGDESYDDDDNDDDDDTLFSIMEAGIARHWAFDSDNDDEYDPVVRAFQNSAQRDARITRATRAVKRSYDDVFNDDEDASSSELESAAELHDKNLLDYLNIRSPSLRPKFGADEDSDHSSNPLNPHRHKTYDIQEQPKEEAEEERNERQEARDARRRARAEARAKAAASKAERDSLLKTLQEEAHEVATAAVKKQLADLEDERDAALQLAKEAVYERDKIDAETEDRARDMDKLRTLLRELIDREFPHKDKEATKEEKNKNEAVQGQVAEGREGAMKNEGAEEDETETETNEEVEHKTKDSKQGDEQENSKAKGEHDERPSATEDNPAQHATETDLLPELPSTSDFMRRASRRSSRHFTRPPVSPIPIPPLTPYPPLTPTLPIVPATPSTPMANWDRQRLVNEVQRMLHATAPPPTPLVRQFNQRPPPPSPALSLFNSGTAAYIIQRARKPLGTGIFASILDILLTILLMIVKQKTNVETVGRWIRSAFLVPAYLTLTNIALRLWNRRQRLSLPPLPNRTRGQADVPDDATGVDLPLVASPASHRSIASLQLHDARTALALAYRQRIRHAYILFPRDALAELTIFNFVVFSIFLLVSTISERNLWLDANNTADAPAQYFQTAVLRYRHDTGSCSTMPLLVPGPYHFCACIPTLFDPRIIIGPLVYLMAVWHDSVLDYLWLVAQWLAWGLNHVSQL